MSYNIIQDQIKIILKGNNSSLEKIKNLSELNNSLVPKYLIDYIENFLPNQDSSIVIHEPKSIDGYRGSDVDKNNIIRSRGFIGNRELEKDKYPNAIHHINILFNQKGQGRLFYKYGHEGGIRFLKAREH